jgi:hypothetical protein
VRPALTERDLPDVEELFVATTRVAAMGKAAQIYNDTTVSAHLRAQAAFIVAQGHYEAGNLDEAGRWGQAALSVNQLDAPGRTRSERESRIRSWLLRLSQTRDTTGS